MTCPTCGSNESTIYLTKPAQRAIYTIVKCTQCGLLYLDPMPTDDERTAYYNSPAYFHGDEAGYTSDYTKQRASIERESLRRLGRIEALLPKPLGSARRILDLGCAAGYFLGVAQRRGWDIAGVELARDMAAHASASLGITVGTGFDPDKFDAASFDAITLWEVIEHLPQACDTLRAARHLIKPGGVVAISTPNTGHWQAQTHPEWWREFKPPAHLVFFTDATLGETLQRSGFTRVTFEHTRPLTISPRLLARLHGIRDVFGDGANPRTPFWPLTSSVYRAVNMLGAFRHRGEDIYIGLEAYAQP